MLMMFEFLTLALPHVLTQIFASKHSNKPSKRIPIFVEILPKFSKHYKPTLLHQASLDYILLLSFLQKIIIYLNFDTMYLQP